MKKIKYVNDKLSKLKKHEKVQKLYLNDGTMEFDATSSYPSATWDENSVYPEKETGIAFKPHITTYVKAFNHQNCNDSATLKLKYYNPLNLIFQHLPVKEKVKNIEVNRMRNGYIIDNLPSVDIQEISRNGGKVIRIYEGNLERKL